jgi:hypothetical protein
MSRIVEFVSIIVVSIAVIIITAFLFGIPISWLWNLFCPKVFGLAHIDWVDGAVLYTLSRLLFASFYSK